MNASNYPLVWLGTRDGRPRNPSKEERVFEGEMEEVSVCKDVGGLYFEVKWKAPDSFKLYQETGDLGTLFRLDVIFLV